jgi:uncharacterized protein
MPPRYAPAKPLPPYAYVPGHDLPHPVNDPRGHSSTAHVAPKPSAVFALPPTGSAASRRDLAACLAADEEWRHAVDLFNGGWYWESHEAWEGFWHAMGRSTPEARFVQGLIHLAAAAVKIREGKPHGVARHTQRAGELLGGSRAAPHDLAQGKLAGDQGGRFGAAAATLGLTAESLAAVLGELEAHKPACWHVARAAVVRVVACELRLTE